MEKIYQRRGVAIDLDAPTPVRFAANARIEEMVGNLVDNACKWAQMRVSVEVVPDTAAQPMVRIVVDDDGPGLNPRNAIASPGAGNGASTRPNRDRGSACPSCSS
jgi:signal transduction histidine kinase